jgi:hypothetical protein
MFSTHSDSENSSKSQLYSKGHHAWPHVELELPIPWFVVNFTVFNDGIQHEKTILLSTIMNLLEFNKITTITEVNLVCPWYMNHQGRWTMDPLIEILQGNEPEPEAKALRARVYVVKNGERYVESFMGTIEENILDLKTIFKAN